MIQLSQVPGPVMGLITDFVETVGLSQPGHLAYGHHSSLESAVLFTNVHVDLILTYGFIND